MDKEFEKFLRDSLRGFLKQRVEEVSRSKLSYLYKNKEGELRSDTEIRMILDKFYSELNKIVNLYINMLKKEDLDTPKKISNNPNKVKGITKKVEKELIKKMEEIAK